MQRVEDNSNTLRTILSVFASIAFHAAIAALILGKFMSTPVRVAPSQLAVKARVIDQSAIDRVHERDRKAEEDRKAKEQAEEEERQRKADEEHAEQERVEKEKFEQVKLQQQKQAEIVQREAAAKKQRDEADRKRVADLKRKQQEIENKKKSEQAARAQAQRESELKAQLAEEQGRMQARSSGLLGQYVAMIEQHVIRHWNRPASARPGIACEVKVTQAPGGTVLNARVGKCNGDAAVIQSIEAAVLRASPLPQPPDSRLFERELLIIFKPNE
jgi:colicin import membrane protein